jgi:glycosyltransferase involved in cell wall biosynthesis
MTTNLRRKIRTYVFWMNIQSFHLSAFVRALAERPNAEVWFGFEEDLPVERKKLGWNLPDFGKAKLFDSRDPAQFESLVSRDGADTCHAFGSYFQLPRAGAAFRRLKSKPCSRVWISEAFNYFGFKGWLRTQRVRWLALTEARTHFDHVFAMGELGTDFFRRAWLRPQQLREFAYTVEFPPIDFYQPTTNNQQLNILYVGQLIHRKGVDLLLNVLQEIDPTKWSLKIVGDGPESYALQALSKKNALTNNVQFCGVVPNHSIQAYISSADVLVLPSRWDGWGAVVNEALHCGTRTITSTSCGASSLIKTDQIGWIFERENQSSLRESIDKAIESIKEGRNRRLALTNWAMKSISGDTVADHFVQCIEADLAPKAPWYN